MVHAENYDPGDIGGAMDASNPAIIRTSFSEKAGVTSLEMVMKINDAVKKSGGEPIIADADLANHKYVVAFCANSSQRLLSECSAWPLVHDQVV